MPADKTIFITGAASGIGRDTALLFARKGWLVGLTDVNQPGLAALEKEIGGERCLAQVMDVTDAGSYHGAVDAFMEKTNGRMDVLFNNAGVLYMGVNEDLGLAEQHRTVDVNLKGILNGIHCSLPYLKKTPGARIISMSSLSAVYGVPELAVYSATKHAVRALTEALDIELEQYGIMVSDIMAPYVATPMIQGAAHQAHSVASTGIKVRPEQVAGLVWKAAHGRKLHWKIHYLTYLQTGAFWLLPFIRRPLMKHLCLTPKST
jgi:NADP-dependent 3-hydroxy acid dehydrogenase YdfG